jgi:hypothetical protein
MVTLHVHLRVGDYLAWKLVFDNVMLAPAADGVRSYRIWRGADDPSFVVCEYAFDSRSAAEAFVYDPRLAQEIERAGFPAGQTSVEYLDEVAFRSPDSP